MQELFLGVDFHKKSSFVTGMTGKGQVVLQRQIQNDKEQWESLLQELPRKTKVVVEATCNWYYLYELIENRFEVTLAHPLKTKAIASAKIKNDKVDSQILAHLLRSDLIPTAYIPPRDVRDLRELLRYRIGLVRQRTLIKNRIHAVLSKNGLIFPFSDPLGKKGAQWLRSQELREVYRNEINGYLDLAESLAACILDAECKISEQAQLSDQVRLLMTMPGIGEFSALLIHAEIGDINRFPSAEKLCSYAGLAPSVRASGERIKMGPITKQGSHWLRWILVEAAHHLVKGSDNFKAHHDRVKFKKGSAVAKVAIARKALKVIYYMLRNNEPFMEKRNG